MLSGLLLQHFGFTHTFYAFALIATVAACVFTSMVPETKHAASRNPVRSPQYLDWV
jgi:membrane-bound metal-dependent hydrolase YbcI (DUF457 family)